MQLVVSLAGIDAEREHDRVKPPQVAAIGAERDRIALAGLPLVRPGLKLRLCKPSRGHAGQKAHGKRQHNDQPGRGAPWAALPPPPRFYFAQQHTPTPVLA